MFWIPAPVKRLFSTLLDVDWASITSSAPYLKKDTATGKIVGAAAPSGGGGGGAVSPLTLTSTDAYQTPLTLLAALGAQYAKLFNIKNSAGNSVFSIDPDGLVSAGGVTAGAIYTNAIRPTSIYAAYELPQFGRFTWRTGTNFTDPLIAQLSLINSINPILQVTNASAAFGGVAQKGLYIGDGATNAPAASTLGTVTRKVRAFDENGNAIGWIAVYDSIT